MSDSRREWGENRDAAITRRNAAEGRAMQFLTSEQVCTVRDVLRMARLPLDAGEFADVLVAKPRDLEIQINPDGRLWSFCDGPVLFGMTRVIETPGKAFPYELSRRGFVVHMPQRDRIAIAQVGF